MSGIPADRTPLKKSGDLIKILQNGPVNSTSELKKNIVFIFIYLYSSVPTVADASEIFNIKIK